MISTSVDTEKENRDRVMLLERITSKVALQRWLKYYLDVDLADCTVSRFATSNPLDMVWKIYQFCASETNDEPVTIRFIAGRSSQKTLSSAVLAILLPLHFGRGIVHLGGTIPQANRAYSYFRKFANKPYVKDYLQGDPTQKNSKFVVNGEEVEVEILSISPMAVQGPHQPVVSLDELASLSPDKMVAYQDVSGIPIYTQDGKPWINFGISSRKGKYTIIETEYDDRKTNGIQFEFWTVLENTKRCPDEISGTTPLQMHVNVVENITIKDEQFDLLPIHEQAKFETVQAFDKCFTCPLSAVCGGDLKKQTSTCKTLRPTKSVIQEFKSAPTVEWFLSQKMSMAPSSEGAVYSRFKRENFEKTPREMWQIFTGEDPGFEVTKKDLIERFIKAGVRRYSGIDHGITHPTAIVVAYEDGIGNAYIMKVHEQAGLEPPEVVELARKMQEEYKFTVMYPDTASPGVNKMLSKVVRIYDDFTKKVENGITAIRSKISPTTGGTRLYGLKGECESLISNLEKYHFSYDTSGKLTDTPVKDNDDSHDALSYIAQNVWISRGQIIIPRNEEKKEQTPEEYKLAIQKQYDNWLTTQIKTVTQEQGGENATQTSKKQGFHWGI